MTYKEELGDLNDQTKYKSIGREDEEDAIPEDKKLLIELHQNKFDNF